jgi:DNA mismatch endonuclease (patch repair protein)
MADNLTRQQRSMTMSSIRARGNQQTEIALARLLRRAGVTGWRRHVKLPGCPDFSFATQRLVVFVDGCFWHGCPRCYRRPTTNRRYWDKKIIRNRRRDREVNRTLRKAGWRVLRVWECALVRQSEMCMRRIQSALASQ